MFIIRHFHAAEQHRICRIRSLNCLSKASFQTPGSFEERRVSASGGQVNGCTFFGSFLYASKEMNIKCSLATTYYFGFQIILLISKQPS